MRSRRLLVALSGAVAGCVTALSLTTGAGAAAPAEPADPVDLGGAELPASPSTNPADPTDVAPGLWQAELGSGFSQYFIYERRMKDSRVHIGALGAPQTGDSDGIEVVTTVGDPASPTPCGRDSRSTAYSFPHALIGASVAVGEPMSSSTQTCRSATQVRIEVRRGSTNPSSMPYVLKIVEEAPAAPELDSAGDPVDADSGVEYTLPAAGSAKDVAGATSFDDAPQLDVGSGPVTISATVTEGTERLWRVPVGWGDQALARVDIPWATGADAETFKYSGAELSVRLVQPTRATVSLTESGAGDNSTADYIAEPQSTRDPEVAVAAALPVRQVNGEAPGDYWIAIAAETPGDDREPVAVPFELTVEVDRVARDAEPSYNSAVLSPDNSSGPSGYAPSRPFLVADDTFAAVASGNPVVADDADDAWLNGRRWAGLGVGALSLVCLAGGVLRLRARR